MSGITLDVGIQDATVRRLFAKLERRTGNVRPALKSIGEYMLRRTDDRFKAERDPWGNRWKPLSPSTLKKKKNSKILTESHMLKDTMNFDARKNSVEIGNPQDYGAIQQLGGKTGRGHKVVIPARPYLGINNADEREFEHILSEYLMSL